MRPITAGERSLNQQSSSYSKQNKELHEGRHLEASILCKRHRKERHFKVDHHIESKTTFIRRWFSVFQGIAAIYLYNSPHRHSRNIGTHRIDGGLVKCMMTRRFLDELTYEIVGCAIEVHKQLGP